MIAWFAKNGVAANLLAGIILLAGVISIRGLKMELFPDFDLDIVTVSAVYPGAAPLEVEDGICKQIEEKIWDLTGIKEMTSFARENTGVVSIQVEKGKDAKTLADEIKVRVDAISNFPEEAEKPIVKKSLADLTTWYKEHPEDAQAVITVGQSQPRYEDATTVAS